MTERIQIDPHNISPEAFARAADVLRGGGLVAFPTETVYGLGANALDPDAVARIYTAKGRPSNNPIIVHVANAKQVQELTIGLPSTFVVLTTAFWPGPLTVVLPKSPLVPDIVTGGGSTVAVRMPAHPVALALLREVNLPLAAPSANRSSELSPTTADHVLRGLDGRIDMVLDAGPTTAGIESTVLDLTTQPPRLLRPGPITPAQIEAVIGHITLIASLNAGEKAPLASPGMLPRHYAPRTPLECLDTGDGERVEALIKQGLYVCWLRCGGEDNFEIHGWILVSLPKVPREYATQLYALLHQLDEMGLDRIVVQMPPDSDEWLAIRDRLRRAAHT